MKSNTGVYKACSIVNKRSLDKQEQFYQGLVRTITGKYIKEIDRAEKKQAAFLKEAVDKMRPRKDKSPGSPDRHQRNSSEVSD